MVFPGTALVGDFAYACLIEHILENPAFSAADTDGQLSVFISVFAGERDGSFTIDQPGEVCGFSVIERL